MPERVVDADRAGRDGVDRGDRAFLAEAHDRPFAELLFNLADSNVERLVAFLLIVERHAISLGGMVAEGCDRGGHGRG